MAHGEGDFRPSCSEVGASNVACGVGAAQTPRDTRTVKHEVCSRSMSFYVLSCALLFLTDNVDTKKIKGNTTASIEQKTRVFQTSGPDW